MRIEHDIVLDQYPVTIRTGRVPDQAVLIGILNTLFERGCPLQSARVRGSARGLKKGQRKAILLTQAARVTSLRFSLDRPCDGDNEPERGKRCMSRGSCQETDANSATGSLSVFRSSSAGMKTDSTRTAASTLSRHRMNIDELIHRFMVIVFVQFWRNMYGNHYQDPKRADATH